MKTRLLLLVFISIFSSTLYATTKAFIGAEGSGCWAAGGRGGRIYEVTNLTNDANVGSGSIVDALSEPNRIVVFRVAGTIQLNGTMLEPKSNTTIAGQTAPGDGICIKGRFHLRNNVHDIIIRYLRIRVDEGAANSSGDAIDIDYCNNVIIDHVSGSYSRDETISCQEDCNNVTVQWCIMSEGLTYENHSYGSLVRGEYGQEKTYHHNLYAHNFGRNPRPGNYTSGSSDPEGLHFDFRNNVVYNWLKTVPGTGDSGDCISRYNFIGNVYIPGPESTNNGYGFRESSTVSYGYFADNSYNDVVDPDPWRIVLFGIDAGEITAYKARSYLVPMEPVTTTSPAQAKIDVLGNAGASLKRDAVDTRIVNDVINKTGHTIENTSDLADPWPTLLHAPCPQDSDHDGMPDWWEDVLGLNPNDASDRNADPDADGYTNVEDYLNYLAAGGTTMGWATLPHGLGSGSIAMTAATAIDTDGVQYYFQCVSGGGHDSGWQSGSTYTDTGLTSGTTYSYRVKVRCASNLVETQYSAVSSSTTELIIDITAPTPNPMTWTSLPNATGIDTITMTATTARDISGVEYYFANVTDPAHDSGWQDSSTYTDTGLNNNMTYTYIVAARDKSAKYNQTAWSADANATTIRFICTDPITGDLNLDCRINFIDLVTMASTYGTGAIRPNYIINGTFDTTIDSWLFANVSGATGTMTTSFDSAAGEPVGSALISADNTVATNGHRFYQIFSVVSGRQYTLAGRWSGNIVGLVTNPTGGSLRNWAEVIISFESSTSPSNWTASSAIKYKKAYGAGTTNTSTGIWGWEDITASPTNGGPTNGVFTASNSYMVIAFNVGGRVGSGTPFINLDNITVMETAVICPPYDLNDDCTVDIEDIAFMADDWLVCNRIPAQECWQ
jgi:hypothetical protein